MSKNLKELENEWGYKASTIRKYCASGIIPPAEKNKGKWVIPDEWPKPPMTRHRLCFLLDTIFQLKHGAIFDALKLGNKEEVKAGYDYLISSGFISFFNTDNLSHELVNATVTPRGEALIERDNKENKKSAHFTAHLTAKAGVGLASVEGGIKLSNSDL
jgi:hypothetical protein